MYQERMSATMVPRNEAPMAARKAGSVREQMDRLSDIEQGLVAAIDRLEKLVDPVLYSGPEAGSVESLQSSRPACGLGQELQGRCDVLEALINRLERMANKVDL